MPLDLQQLEAVINTLKYIEQAKRRVAFATMYPLLNLQEEEIDVEFSRVNDIINGDSKEHDDERDMCWGCGEYIDSIAKHTCYK